MGKAPSGFRCPSLSEALSGSADGRDFSHLASHKPRPACLLTQAWDRQSAMALGTEQAVLTSEVSRVESSLQDFSSEEEVVGEKGPQLPS